MLAGKNHHETRQRQIKEHNEQAKIQSAKAKNEIEELRLQTDKKHIIYHAGEILGEADEAEHLNIIYNNVVKEKVGAIIVNLR